MSDDPFAERAQRIRQMKPQLWADLTMYATEKGGKRLAAVPGWGCPCTLQREKGDGWFAFDGWPLIDRPITPGERRKRVAFVFLLGEQAAEHLSKNGTFYLWEGRIVGEATILPVEISN